MATKERTAQRLYYHKTDGGAEYLTDTFIEKEGAFTDETTIIVRIDGDITKDAELCRRESPNDSSCRAKKAEQWVSALDSLTKSNTELLAALRDTLEAFIGQYRANHGQSHTHDQNTAAIDKLPGVVKARAAIRKAEGGDV